MSTLTATCFITLDNVVEDPHLWSGDFQSEDTGDYNDAVLEPADALLLGRTTYDGFAAAWPSRSGDRFADKFNAMPKHVVTSSPDGLTWNNSHRVTGDLVDAVRQLKAEQDLLTWGSPTLVQLLLEHGLVDRLELLVSPIVRGRGIKLYGERPEQIGLRVERVTQLSGGMLAVRLAAGAKA